MIKPNRNRENMYLTILFSSIKNVIPYRKKKKRDTLKKRENKRINYLFEHT